MENLPCYYGARWTQTGFRLTNHVPRRWDFSEIQKIFALLGIYSFIVMSSSGPGLSQIFRNSGEDNEDDMGGETRQRQSMSGKSGSVLLVLMFSGCVGAGPHPLYNRLGLTPAAQLLTQRSLRNNN